MNAMAEACREGELNGLVDPVVVISSKEGAEGLLKAQAWGIPTREVLRKDFPLGIAGMNAYGECLKKVLAEYSPDVVTLNGFLAQVSEDVIDAYAGNIFNQHPGPVPDFGGPGMYGKRVHAAIILFSRVTEKPNPFTEMVAQRVSPSYDHGAVVKRTRVDILKNDTVESLQERSLPIEHQLQIELLKDVANGVVKEIVNSKLFIAPMDDAILIESKKIAMLLYPNG